MLDLVQLSSQRGLTGKLLILLNRASRTLPDQNDDIDFTFVAVQGDQAQVQAMYTEQRPDVRITPPVGSQAEL